MLLIRTLRRSWDTLVDTNTDRETDTDRQNKHIDNYKSNDENMFCNLVTLLFKKSMVFREIK